MRVQATAHALVVVCTTVVRVEEAGVLRLEREELLLPAQRPTIDLGQHIIEFAVKVAHHFRHLCSSYQSDATISLSPFLLLLPTANLLLGPVTTENVGE